MICNPVPRPTDVGLQEQDEVRYTGAGCKRKRTEAFRKWAPWLQRISQGPPQCCSARKRPYGDEKGEESDAVEHDGDSHVDLDVGLDEEMHDHGEVTGQEEFVAGVAALQVHIGGRATLLPAGH